ncbi:hypothetical protein HK098_001669 [Nowakowskiella sp. JEL0407]|nr:hypothetical protein HK098_001669 [Nowakowskiella sp. JEL0407]
MLVGGVGGCAHFWDLQLETFMKAGGYSVCLVDLRGTGFSSAPLETRWTTTILAQDLVDLYTKYLSKDLKWEKFHLVGISLGGMVSQELAYKIPEKIASLTLESTIAYFNGVPLFTLYNIVSGMIFGNPVKTPEDFAEMVLNESFPKSWRDAPGPAGFKTQDDWMRDFILARIKRTGLPNPKAKAALQNAVITHYVSPARLSSLKGKFPVLCITGDDDNILIQPSSSQYLAESLGGRIEILKGGRHLVRYQDREWHDKILLDFIRSASSNSLALAAIDAHNLPLVRVFEKCDDNSFTGVKGSSKNKDILESIVSGIKAAESPEETDYDGTETPIAPESYSIVGWQFRSAKVFAKIMNRTYDLIDYLQYKDSEEGTFDIMVIIPSVQSRLTHEMPPYRNTTQAEDSFLTLWRRLGEVWIIQDGYRNSFLQLPEGVHILGNYKLGSTIIVRECYEELLHSFDIQRNDCVISALLATFCLFTKNDVFGYSGVSSIPAHILNNRDNFLIVDAHDPPFVPVRTILVSSSIWSQIEKFANRPTAGRRCMSVWSWNKIYSLWYLKYLAEIPVELVLELCRKWGMIPRSVLGMAENNSYQADMHACVKNVDFRALEQSFSRIRYPPDIVNGEILHLICEPDYYTTRLVFASYYIAELILEEYETWSREGLRQLLRQKNTPNFKETPKDQSLALDSTLEIPERITRTFKTLDDLDPSSGYYYMPLSNNFESINYIVFPNMLFQITVGNKHGVKVNALNQLKNGDVLDLEKTIYLIFVVPEDIYPTFVFQDYTEVGDAHVGNFDKDASEWISSKYNNMCWRSLLREERVFADDVVRYIGTELIPGPKKLGIVSTTYWDDYEGEYEGYYGDDIPLHIPKNHILVCFLDKNSGITISQSSVEVVDRAFFVGDIAKRTLNNGDSILGKVVNVKLFLDLEHVVSGKVVHGVESSKVRFTFEIETGMWVSKGKWCGIVASYEDDVGIAYSTPDGQPIPTSLDSVKFISVYDENSVFYPKRYVPGQKVYSKNSNETIKGITQTCRMGSVNVRWLAHHTLDDSPAEPQPSSYLSADDNVVVLHGKQESTTQQVNDNVYFKSDDLYAKYDIPIHSNSDIEKVMQVVNLKTIIDVEWQDGTLQRDVDATKVDAVLHTDEYDIFPRDFVRYFGEDEAKQELLNDKVGIVMRVNARERTATVKWYNYMRTELVAEEEELSVYELTQSDEIDLPSHSIVVVSPQERDTDLMVLKDDWVCEVLSVEFNGNILVRSLHTGFEFKLPPSRLILLQYDEDEESDNESANESWSTVSGEDNEEERETEDLMDESDESENKENFEDVDSDEEELAVPIKTTGSFDIVNEVPPNHVFVHDFALKLSHRVIMKEVNFSAFKSLPDGVFVRTFASRMDLFRVLISGPPDTPYEDGLFMFDIYLPDQYPQHPPHVYFHSWSFGGGKLNPNLYEDGKICLSLLGTWHAKDPSETWRPSSNLLQVIVSIQGLVLNRMPYYNEAGYEKQIGSEVGLRNTIAYNERAFMLTIRFVRHIISNPPEPFANEIKDYYYNQGHLRRLIERCSEIIERSEKAKNDTMIFPETGFPIDVISKGCLMLLKSNLMTLNVPVTPNPAHKLNSPFSETNKTPPMFSLIGIKLSYLRAFVSDMGGDSTLRGKTTSMISDEIIKPTTMRIKDSMCQYLSRTGHVDCIGTATWFISHAWSCEFLQVVDAIFGFFDTEFPGIDVIIWFDLFSNSQHDTNRKEFTWWTGTFMNAIQSLSNVLMIMVPWDDPIPLKRAWCVFELYACVFTKSRFEVGMSSEERMRFLNSVEEDPAKYFQMLSRVKSQNSDAFKNEDKVGIHQAIQTEIGFSQLDAIVFEVFRHWMVNAFKKEIAKSQGLGDNLQASYWTFALGRLFVDKGDLNEVEPLYVRCLQQWKVMLGENHRHTLICMNNLAGLYRSQGKYEHAEPLVMDCVERMREIMGDGHPNTLISIINLASLYNSQGKYSQAEYLYERYLGRMREILGNDHLSTLTSISNLAGVYVSQRKYERSESLYLECVERMKVSLGDDHPITLTCIKNLAQLYELQGRFENAERYFVDCLRLRKRLLGDVHPSTLVSINNLAHLYESQGRHKEALPLYIDCLEKRKQILGQEHPDTITSINNLAYSYHTQGMYDLAESLYLECVEKMKRVLGESHPLTCASIKNLVELYELQDKYELVALYC